MSTPKFAKYSAAHDILRSKFSRVAGTAARLLTKASRRRDAAAQSSPYTLATALYFADHPTVADSTDLSEDSLATVIDEDPAFDKYLSEANELLEDAPANAAGTGAIAGLLGDPPGRRRKKR